MAFSSLLALPLPLSTSFPSFYFVRFILECKKYNDPPPVRAPFITTLAACTLQLVCHVTVSRGSSIRVSILVARLVIHRTKKADESSSCDSRHFDWFVKAIFMSHVFSLHCDLRALESELNQ